VIRHRRVHGQGKQRCVREEPDDLERQNHGPSVLSDIESGRRNRGPRLPNRNGEESGAKLLCGFGGEQRLHDEREHRRTGGVADEDARIECSMTVCDP
jgi:hypothetical protein